MNKYYSVEFLVLAKDVYGCLTIPPGKLCMCRCNVPKLMPHSWPARWYTNVYMYCISLVEDG